MVLVNTVSTPVEPVPLWIDCDVGHDDALAIMLAAYNPHIKLLGISTVSGNTSVKNCTKNAIQVLKAAGIEGVKVYEGAAKPLVKKVFHASEYHGPNGLIGAKYLPKADYAKYFDGSCSAVNAMYNAITSSPVPISIAAIGPLTNIALLLGMYPDVVAKIKTLLIMGGSIGMGNITPAAEFNIFCDPEAAHAVLNSTLNHVVMVPLDTTGTVLASKSIVRRIKDTLPDPHFAELITGLFWHYSSEYSDISGVKDGAPVHDPAALAYIFMSELFTGKHIRVDVECNAGLCNGRTLCDFYNCTGQAPNCWVATSLDIDTFWNHMIDSLTAAAKNCCLDPMNPDNGNADLPSSA
ncbi:hypothetical protein IWW36_000196 [Coemansia brasiliensis]|uniref:Inosine/uridine-preferring nucleoside hydrolase domain-containing protein n=1 Tax=Coemansia brasiliensis TaxID=2650707 RepID=A0A9W8IGB2_9FUNG|nr:hypothetical protein IWW36_000196 [Coemansia brasiliensis]